MTRDDEADRPSSAAARRAAWMALAQQGDRAAYDRLLEDLDGYVRRVLRSQMWSGEDLDDACQEVLLTLHRAIRTYDPSRPFNPWFHALARHALVSMRRRRRREPVLDAMGEDALRVAASSELGDADVAGLVDAALERLPGGQREAVRMLKVEGLSVDEAARRAGTSPGNLRVRAHRGYRTLKALLGSRE